MRSIGWPVCLARIAFSRCARQDLPGVDLDVGGLALEAAQGLVDHHARVRQAQALALGAAGQQHRAHAAAWPTQMVLTSGLMNCIVS